VYQLLENKNHVIGIVNLDMVFADLNYFEKEYMYGTAYVYASTRMLFFHYF
jgi:hypothetical protein